MVRYMLVPVSPSGTGKTLIALMASTWRSSQAVAVANIARNSLPESVLSTDGLVMERLLGGAFLLARGCAERFRAGVLPHLALRRYEMI